MHRPVRWWPFTGTTGFNYFSLQSFSPCVGKGGGDLVDLGVSGYTGDMPPINYTGCLEDNH